MALSQIQEYDKGCVKDQRQKRTRLIAQMIIKTKSK